jgi:hypothetical protein
VNREVARIQRAYAVAYYRRVGHEAVREATGRWLAAFGSSALVSVLTIVLLAVAGDGLSSALWGLVAFVAVWGLIAARVVVSVLPRIERDLELKEDALRVLTQRRNVANELRTQMIQCRMSAGEARAAILEPEHRGLIPDTFHQRALMAAEHAENRLEWLSKQPGQPPQQQQILELTSAVSSAKCASFDDAIAQLEALADVIERQLSSGVYW